MFFRCLVLISSTLTVLSLPASAAPAPAASAGKTCVDCHRTVVAKRVIHTAIGQYAKMEQGCESCHTASHANKKGELALAAAVPDLCYLCHDKELFSRKNVHPPVAGGDCLSCHNPHASDAPRLLSQPVPAICQNCHADKTNGKHILGGYGFGDNHPIQGRVDPTRKGREFGCVSCHNPHSSDKRALIVGDAASGDTLCSLCHSKIMVRP